MKQRYKRRIKIGAPCVIALVLFCLLVARIQDAGTALMALGVGCCFFLGLKFYEAGYSWWYARKLQRMPLEAREAECARTLSEAEAVLNELREEPRRRRERSRIPWRWRVADVALGFISVVAPPLLLSSFLDQPLSRNAEGTVYQILSVAAGFGFYSLGRAYVFKRWQQRRSTMRDAAS
jgi:hypothetical protein